MNELLLMCGRSTIQVDRIQTFKVAGLLIENHLARLCVLAGQSISNYFGYLVHEKEVPIHSVFDDIRKHVYAIWLGQHVHFFRSLEFFVEQPVQKTAVRRFRYEVTFALLFTARN